MLICADAQDMYNHNTTQRKKESTTTISCIDTGHVINLRRPEAFETIYTRDRNGSSISMRISAHFVTLTLARLYHLDSTNL